MLNLKAVAGLVLICFVVLSFPPFLNAVGSESSPTQVVEHWITVYPKDLNTAATLTTANLRDGPERSLCQGCCQGFRHSSKPGLIYRGKTSRAVP